MSGMDSYVVKNIYKKTNKYGSLHSHNVKRPYY